MKFNALELINFKRFTHLTLADIPADARLVLLIGSNGSGKSSIFDAFELLNKTKRNDGLKKNQLDYYKKNINSDFEIKLSWNNVTGHNDNASINSSLKPLKQLDALNFYGRSSFRQVPRLTRTTLGNSTNIENDSDRPRFFIDRDERFENDIEKITSIILRDFFRSPDAQSKIKAQFISPINESLSRIFGEKDATRLELLEIIPPLEGNVAQVTFRKGSTEFHYNQLSAGEKEVINILINLSSRRESLEDAICFFDEIDLHLNTQLQFQLLQEITEYWIPESSQFWTASHSLGFIEYARAYSNAVILDLDDLNFDIPQVIIPTPKENTDIFEIAVGRAFLPNLLAGKRICFVENNDSEYYASLGLTHFVFAKANNRNAVYHRVLNDQSVSGIVDRDYLTDDDIALIRTHYPNLFVLPYYSIENLMYHPDNLAAYYQYNNQKFDRNDYISQIAAQKQQEIEKIIPSLALKRTEYQYFKEQKYSNTAYPNRFTNKGDNSEQAEVLARYLQSDDFETWYKVFPMKTYAKEVPQRQHISKKDLAKTPWFKHQIDKLLG